MPVIPVRPSRWITGEEAAEYDYLKVQHEKMKQNVSFETYNSMCSRIRKEKKKHKKNKDEYTAYDVLEEAKKQD